ncbi:MAG: leucine-rich repeat domain-containing protein [Bacteroidales bacterium]|nr:leucine-rich repeat domain-containing protein [Bacteroidales bacterium]
MKRYILLTLLMVGVLAGSRAQTFIKSQCPTGQEIECKKHKGRKSVEIVKFTGRDFLGDLSVPSVVVFEGKTYKVTAIGKEALFRAGGSLHSIHIPKTITSIGKYAFYELDSLVAIRVDKRNRVYDSRENCNAIIKSKTNELVLGCQGTVIPSTVTSIGESAFASCTHLTDIFIPNSVKSIGAGAFFRCPSLTAISIPNSVKRIGDVAFYYCYSLASVSLSRSVKSIGRDVFHFCDSLACIHVDPNNPVYDSRDSCNAIILSKTNKLIVGCQNTIIPNTVKSIGNGAFYHCIGLDSISIPNSITSIGDWAFYHCVGLTSINIPNSVTSIGYGAFYHCVNLTSINIPNSVTSIGNDAFHLCNRLTSINIAEDHPIFKIQEDGETIRIIDKRTGSIVAIIP